MATFGSFPEDFVWGASTSAYQIEGSPLADDAGPSNWHRFTHMPGNVADGTTGDVACDHYRRFDEDVRLMAKLGLRSYRFSISWSRIFPEGYGRVNPKGIAFYSRLIDALLEHDIQPNATLFHWDLPAALEDRGGWLNPEIAGWFAEYARTMFEALDDRVPLWATLNEPWVVMDGGYLAGVLAPGHRSLFEAPRAAHNLLRAHAAAVEVYREIGRHEIGIVVNLEPKVPASDRPEDAAAVVRADAYMNRFFLDPLLRGVYPEELREVFGEGWTDPPQDELANIRAPIDFLGVNYYKRAVVRDSPEDAEMSARIRGNRTPESSTPTTSSHAASARSVLSEDAKARFARNPAAVLTRAREVPQPRATHTALGWPVHAPGLTDTLTWVRDRYGEIPLYVTENGAAFYDPPSAERPIEDVLREDYLRSHVLAAHRALEQGVDLRGYYAWSLLDNFEWAQGLSKRFGVVHVDFETQRRTIKRSGRFYRDVIRSNGGVLFEAGEDAR